MENLIKFVFAQLTIKIQDSLARIAGLSRDVKTLNAKVDQIIEVLKKSN